MSESEHLEIPKTEKKNVQDFLKRYRALGLPGAKKFRRRTRLEQAKHEREVNIATVSRLIQMVGHYKRAFEELKKEENWAVRDTEIVWIGDSDPLQVIKKVEKEAV